MNTKLKSYNGKINPYYYKKEPAKANSPCYCFSAILLDTVCKIKNEDDKYYSQIYLEECKYEEKKTKKNHIEKENIVIPDTDESDDDPTK